MTTSYRSAAKIARESSPDFTSSRSRTTLCHGVQANFAISLLLGYYHVYYHYWRIITTLSLHSFISDSYYIQIQDSLTMVNGPLPVGIRGCVPAGPSRACLQSAAAPA